MGMIIMFFLLVISIVLKQTGASPDWNVFYIWFWFVVEDRVLSFGFQIHIKWFNCIQFGELVK